MNEQNTVDMVFPDDDWMRHAEMSYYENIQATHYYSVIRYSNRHVRDVCYAVLDFGYVVEEVFRTFADADTYAQTQARRQSYTDAGKSGEIHFPDDQWMSDPAFISAYQNNKATHLYHTVRFMHRFMDWDVYVVCDQHGDWCGWFDDAEAADRFANEQAKNQSYA